MRPNKRLIRIGKIKKEKKGKEILAIKPPLNFVPALRKVVINTCFGGFSLSHDAVIEYYKRKGIKAYPFVECRDENGTLDFHRFKPYVKGELAFVIHYSSEPLREDGTYAENAYLSGRDMTRDDPDLVAVVEKLGKKSFGVHAELSIVEIPSDVEWEIEEYDGNEHIAEAHRTWR